MKKASLLFMTLNLALVFQGLAAEKVNVTDKNDKIEWTITRETPINI